MGKKNKKDKKNKKKQQKKRRTLVKRMEKWIDSESWTTDEIVAAGLGSLATAARKKDKKTFTRTVKDGRAFLEHFFSPEEPFQEGSAEDEASSEPVISYSPVGGGWYSVAVDGFEVDKVKGEATAAERAGSLLEAYASTDAVGPDRPSAVTHTGGGWYDVVVYGVPVGRYRGKDNVPDRYADLIE